MQVTPTPGSAGAAVSEAKLQSAIPPKGPAGVAAAQFVDSAVLRSLPAADLIKLDQILQPPLPPRQAAQIDELLGETVRALAEDRVEWAVGRLIEVAMTDPLRAEDLRTLPQLQPIRANVEHMLAQLTHVAHMEAEARLSATEELLERSGAKELPNWTASTDTLLQIAHRLLDAGGHANYVRTSELAANMQSAYWGGGITQLQPAAIEEPAAEVTTPKPRPKLDLRTPIKEKALNRLTVLWRRAPLLVLLLGWFAAGVLAGGTAVLLQAAPAVLFEIWATGFLGLVAFGFWARIWPPRR